MKLVNAFTVNTFHLLLLFSCDDDISWDNCIGMHSWMDTWVNMCHLVSRTSSKEYCLATFYFLVSGMFVVLLKYCNLLVRLKFMFILTSRFVRSLFQVLVNTRSMTGIQCI